MRVRLGMEMTMTLILGSISGSEHYFRNHGYLDGWVAWWIFSAFVKTMPPLPWNAGYFARWSYAALHLLAANIPEVQAAMKGPQAPPSEAKT